MVSASIAVELGQRRGAVQRHIGTERVEHRSALEQLAEILDERSKVAKGGVGDLVASELGQQLLLRRQIEVFVGHHLLPDRFEVVRQSVGGDTLVYSVLKTKLGSLGSTKRFRSTSDGLIEFGGLEDLVRESGEHEIEKVGDVGRFESFRFGEREPILVRSAMMVC